MIAAVVTTRNEEATIGPLVQALAQHGYSVVVIDDASEDNTVHNANHAGAAVIAHTLRIGIGPSLMEGWRWALECGANAILQIDAGGSHDPAEAPRLLDGLGHADMVIGSRFCEGATYTGNRKRAAMSRLAAHMCNNRQIKPRFSDWTSGYRAFSRDAVAWLLEHPQSTAMHSWQIEVLRDALRLHLRVVEVPITYRAGRSSFNRRIAHDAFRVWLTI